MPELVLKETGRKVFVPSDGLADALNSGLYEAPGGDQAVNVTLPGPLGLAAQVPASQLERVTPAGANIESEAAFRAREREARLERTRGGIGNTLLTAGENALDTGSFGGFGILADYLGGEEYREGRLERTEANPVGAGFGTAIGVVGPSLLSAGTGTAGALARATPMGAASAAGARIAKGGGLARTVGAGIFEGGATAIGETIQQLNDSADQLTVERIGSALSSNLLYGGAIGGGAALAGKVLEKGLVRTKAAIDENLAARAVAGDVGDDLASLDAAGLRKAREAEVDTLVAQQVEGKRAVIGDISNYRRTVDEANPFLVITEGEPASLLAKSKKQLRNLMDDPDGLAKNPAGALKALRVQEQAISRTLADAEGVAARLAAQNKKIAKEVALELATLPDNLAEVTLTGSAARRYGAFADVKVPKGGGVNVPREQVAGFLDALQSGKLAGSADETLKKLPNLLEQNRALQSKIEGLSLPKSELSSARLSQIDTAREQLIAGGAAKKGTLQTMVEGGAYGTVASTVSALPIPGAAAVAPFIGAKAAGMLGDVVFGRLGKVSAEAAQRTSKAVGAFLDVTRKAQPVAPILATKVLSSVAFAEDKPARRKAAEPAEPKPTLASLYRKRSEEIRSQTEPGPDGKPVMRQVARQQMAAKLDPIRTAAPLLADKMETLAARRLEFLASVMPRRPDYGALRTGPDNWRPSDFEMRAFARYVAAVEDPGGIEERLATGQITPEDARVMREVYPERLLDLTAQVLDQLPALQQQLPYPRRLALSLLTGVPVDPAMHPPILAALQATYATEDGTDGGQQAPRASAQFGSVKSQEKATPAQERAG